MHAHTDPFLLSAQCLCDRVLERVSLTPTHSGWDILTDFWILFKAERAKLLCTGKHSLSAFTAFFEVSGINTGGGKKLSR